MLIFYAGSVNGRWAPFLVFLPVIISAIGSFFGSGYGNTYVYESGVGWKRLDNNNRPHHSTTSTQQQPSPGFDAFTLILLIILGWFIIQFTVMARQYGLQEAGRRLFFPTPEDRQQQHRHQRGGAQNNHYRHSPLGRTHSERLEVVASIIQQLPITTHHTQEELHDLSIAELKVLAKTKGLKGRDFLNFVEKQDLVDALLAGQQNSSADACIVCQEDYIADDMLRVLPCGHMFHLECVDKWFLSSTDYTRPPACPLCNAELPLPLPKKKKKKHGEEEDGDIKED